MRLIDADALLDRIRNPYEQAEVARWVNEQPTAQPMQWIPCSERMPEDGGLYLVSNKRDTWVSLYDDGEWRSVSFSILLEGVVAWMPLPEPYKGEE